ncbi:MAG: histidine phosphatase family protein [Acetobacteraceae bacterium]
MTRVSFWFLRHGETDWNARFLSQGNADIPLNARGVAQAHAAAAALRGRGIASIVHSPLSRARDTAAIVAAALGVPMAEDEDLREAGFGENEGRPMGDWFAEWVAGRYTPPGGEPFAALAERAVAAVNRALERPPAVLVVAHGALWRAIRGAIGLEVNVRTPNAQPLLVEPAEAAAPWRLTPLALADPPV